MSCSKNVALVASVAFAPLLALPSFALASCASTDAADARQEDASSVIQPSDAGTPEADAADAAPPCEPGDRSCVSKVLSCEEADFCPVPNGLDRRHALTAVWGSSATDVWAVGSGGTILRNDGSGWKPVASGTTETLYVAWGTGPSDVWVVGSTGTILHGPGASPSQPVWTNEAPFTTGELFAGRLFALWGASADDVRTGGQPYTHALDNEGNVVFGNHLHRTGGAWSVLEGFDGKYPQATIRAIWGSSPEDVWISLDNGADEPWARGTLVHGTAPAAGEPLAWRSIDSQSSVVLESLWGSSAGDVWAVGVNGTIRRYTAGATTWAVVDEAKTHETLHRVWGSGPKDVWVVGDAGTILHFDGTTWTEATVAFPLGKKPNLTGVWGSGPNDVWVVGDGYTLHFTGKKAGK